MRFSIYDGPHSARATSDAFDLDASVITAEPNAQSILDAMRARKWTIHPGQVFVALSEDYETLIAFRPETKMVATVIR